MVSFLQILLPVSGAFTKFIGQCAGQVYRSAPKRALKALLCSFPEILLATIFFSELMISGSFFSKT